MKLYDCIIIGGGPAGLSAAIYLGRFNRSVLVIDKEFKGRWNTLELNENYLGFPEGIHSRKLRELGKTQAKKFGAKFAQDLVLSLEKDKKHFVVKCKKRSYYSRTLIISTGVRDILPNVPNIEQYFGKTLFWCITCDGHKTIGKKVVVIGNTDEAASTCLQFLNYTDQLLLITNCSENRIKISSKSKTDLFKNKVNCVVSCIKNIRGKNSFIEELELDTGEIIRADIVFTLLGAIPNSKIAEDFDIRLDSKGYIKTDFEQRTNVPLIYAAGDVTKNFAHQIVTAAHEGATAAQSANYDLYASYQKE